MGESAQELVPGIERSDEFTVAPPLETDVGGTIGAGVLCRTRATLREVVEGRKLRFDVEVTEGERTIGVGTHERRVVGQAGPPTA